MQKRAQTCAQSRHAEWYRAAPALSRRESPSAEDARPLPPCPVSPPCRARLPRSWAWPSARLGVQRSAAAHMGASLLERRPFEGCAGCFVASRVQTELRQSCPSFLLSGYLRTMDAVCACSFPCKNYSCMGRHFILSDLSSSPPPSPEGLFSGRLSSKRAQDTAGKQSGAKQTFFSQNHMD